MADKKISALTGATTPLAGTEVLPIVQGGSTVKVSVSDLTAGRQVNANRVAAGGITNLATIGSPSIGSIGGTAYDGNFTLAAANLSNATNQSGVQLGWNTANKNGIISSGYGDGVAALEFWNFDGVGWANQVTITQTGNIAIKVAGKGIDFSANTHAAGMTSELLNWYETGTFTPAWGGSTTDPTNSYTSQTGRYTRIGDIVYCWVELVTSASSGGSGNLQIKGLPFAARDAELNAGFASGFSLNFPSGCFANSTTTVTMTNTVPGVEQAYLGIATLGASSYLACTIMYRIA